MPAPATTCPSSGSTDTWGGAAGGGGAGRWGAAWGRCSALLHPFAQPTTFILAQLTSFMLSFMHHALQPPTWFMLETSTTTPPVQMEAPLVSCPPARAHSGRPRCAANVMAAATSASLAQKTMIAGSLVL